ncbi:hypothetical protein J2X73_001254 [Novosphingobium sp. 1748]|uniref:hypothetical protein n=1 Tax=unclassified Novosphingobium TaxID=2644732 RepID=UPI0025F12871|nr:MULTISPECIES: hypothetical protein [unclassified Novosphingobium]MDR6706899.1 hypothetical protein [Novosphingobium sp. 1748]
MNRQQVLRRYFQFIINEEFFNTINQLFPAHVVQGRSVRVLRHIIKFSGRGQSQLEQAQG